MSKKLEIKTNCQNNSDETIAYLTAVGRKKEDRKGFLKLLHLRARNKLDIGGFSKLLTLKIMNSLFFITLYFISQF